MVSSRKPIVVIGSINIDLVANTERIPVIGETVLGSDFQVHPGGKGANQAVAISRLSYPVQLLGKVGTDSFGDQLLSYLRGADVDITGVERDAGTSGVAMIVVSAQGENSIVVTPGANKNVTPAFLDSHRQTIRNAGMVLTQLEIPVETVEYLARICHEENIPLMLDPAPAQALPRTIFEGVHWFTPNETEASFFLGQLQNPRHDADPEHIAKALRDVGIGGVVLKMGARGVYLKNSDSASQVAAFPVTAVDTTAAGDAFNGAFATALMLGMANSEAVRFASAAAAISVTRTGAQQSMPTLGEVQQLLEEHR